MRGAAAEERRRRRQRGAGENRGTRSQPRRAKQRTHSAQRAGASEADPRSAGRDGLRRSVVPRGARDRNVIGGPNRGAGSGRGAGRTGAIAAAGDGKRQDQLWTLRDGGGSAGSAEGAA